MVNQTIYDDFIRRNEDFTKKRGPGEILDSEFDQQTCKCVSEDRGC